MLLLRFMTLWLPLPERKMSTIEATYYVLKKALSEEFRYAEVEGLEASTPV